MLSRTAPGPEKCDDSIASDKDSLEGPARSITLSGPELITLNDHQWNALCSYDEIVFARTTPEQKLRIVKGKSNMGTRTLLQSRRG